MRDTGIGIDTEHTHLLFKPFTQSDNSITRKFGGTGLGLSICHKLVDLMGGEISVTSTLGQGSTFSFTITADLYHNQLSKFKNSTFNNRKILVIDHNETSCRVLESWLRTWQIDVHTTTSNEHALYLIEAAVHDGQPFDTILLDWRVSGMNVLNISQWLNEKSKLHEEMHPSMIIMAAPYNIEAIQNYTNTIHINGILEKPVMPSNLFNMLCKLNLSEKGDITNDIQSHSQNNTSFAHFDGACILLVEDNAINQEVAINLLKNRGIEVTVASNGYEAINCVQHKTFDAVLMDIHMPVMGGIEATRQIRQLFPDTDLPIIAMTAAVMQEDREHCSASGMVDFIAKPINPDELDLCLKKWLKTSRIKHVSNKHQVDLTTTPDTTFPVFSKNISGFDFVDALDRTNGDHALLARMLQLFAGTHTSTQEKLNEQLRTQESNEAVLLLHNLRGSAATIGAIELAQTAHQLENELKNNLAPQSLPAFEKALNEAISSIKSNNEHHNTITADTDHKNTINRQKLTDLLNELIPYLEEGELIPDTLIHALHDRSNQSGSTNSLSTLLYQIEQFDHEAALISINNLLASLEVEIPK